MEGTVDLEVDGLFRAEAPKLWRALLAWSGVPEIADDALDEAFVQLIARGPEVVSPVRWVWKAAFRIAAGELEHRRNIAVTSEMVGVAITEPASELIAMLAQLPSRQRAVLVLHYYVGYKAREISEILGTSPATVRVQMTTGRRRLGALLERGDDDG